MKTFVYRYRKDIPVKGMTIRWIIFFISALAAFLLILLGRNAEGFADGYCRYFYPFISGIFSRISGIFPFSLGEFIMIAAVIGVIVGIVFLARYIVKSGGQRIKAFFSGFSVFSLIAGILFLIITLNCLICYGRTPFSEYSGLEPSEYTAEELRALVAELIEEANSCAEKVELDGDGRPVKPENFNEIAVSAMENLGEKYSVLDAYYPRPKAAVCSEVMSDLNIAGIYFPHTVEANYNKNMPVSSQGFTVCHELSHLSGFMREDEANFIAFLACRESGDDYFRYSGYIGALAYALNAYYPETTQEDYYGLYMSVSPVIREEYAFRSEYWAKYEKKVTYKASTAVNDAYLKANDQSDGTKSYGRVVDLLIAEKKSRETG